MAPRRRSTPNPYPSLVIAQRVPGTAPRPGLAPIGMARNGTPTSAAAARAARRRVSL